jgi:hypothetical protein
VAIRFGLVGDEARRADEAAHTTKGVDVAITLSRTATSAESVRGSAVAEGSLKDAASAR